LVVPNVTNQHARIGIVQWWQKSDAVLPCLFAQLHLSAGDKQGKTQRQRARRNRPRECLNHR
jgi:hypothetical protein